MEELKLCEELEGERDAIIEALATEIPGNWPEDTSLLDAGQPEAIARAIIPHLHSHLMNAKIAFVFKRSMAKGEKVILGRAAKASPQLQFLADYDFVISVNWRSWPGLTHAQRIAVVDHELSHCGYDLESDKFVTVQHDVEEFGGIIQRWGFWKSDLVPFGRRCAEQIHLFDDDMTVTFNPDGKKPVTMKVNDFSEAVDELTSNPKKMRRALQVAK